MIAIVDYGVGNLFSLRSSLDMIGGIELEVEIRGKLLRAKTVSTPFYKRSK